MHWIDLLIVATIAWFTFRAFTTGLIREVVVDPTRRYFDTNVGPHHHFFLEQDGSLQDIPGEHISVDGVPVAPQGTEVERVDVIVRIRRQMP